MIQISPMRPRRIAVAVVVSALAQLAPTTPASAVTYTWDGEFNTQWDYISLNISTFIFETNWNNEASSVKLPTAADSVLFTGNVPNSNTVNLGATRSVLNATFSSSSDYSLENGILAPSSDTLISNSGVALSSTSGLSTGRNLTLDNGYLSSFGGAVSVGDGPDGVFSELWVTDAQAGGASGGLIRVINGGDLYHNGVAFIGLFGGYGYAEVTGVGSTWTGTSQMTIGESGTGSLAISGGGSVTSSLGVLGNVAGSSGTVTVTGAGSAWHNSEYLFLGNSGTGSLSVSDGATVTDQTGYIGEQSGSQGTATVTGAGSAWHNSEYLILGAFGTGSLSVSGGATVTDQTGYIGEQSGSQGTATVTGAGSAWHNSEYLILGHSGTGSLSVSGGATVTDQTGFIGNQSGSQGTATVTGVGSAWTNSRNLFVGKDGTGSLTIENGGSVYVGDAAQAGATSGWLTVSDQHAGGGQGGHLYVNANSTLTQNGSAVLGDQAGEYGYATVSGTGATWANTVDLYVGDAGTGSLVIENGGSVHVGDAATAGAIAGWLTVSDDDNTGGRLYVRNGSTLTHQSIAVLGDEAAEYGTAFVTGTGTTWSNGGDLLVGSAGTGSLNIQAGAHVSNSDGYLGRANGAVGFGYLDGAGSTWTNNGTLYAGWSGSGVLNIQAGADVSNTVGYLGYNGGSNGAATVNGAGSTWTNTGNLYVGYFGTGTLNVQAGAVVSNVTGQVGAGTTGTATVTGSGSTWTNTGDLKLGGTGTGSLTIENGGRVYVGDAAADRMNNGFVTISDANNTNGMGNGGRLSILNGSTLTHSGSALLGDQASEYGYATVDGAGSTWTNSSFVRVGNGGTGKLTISDGGRFEDTEGYLGFDPGASGTATITGAGSTWENSGALIVARKGTGSLTISDGGKATNTTGYLGTDAGGSGTATVTGTGSTWNNTQDLYVGRDGTGTLTIENIGTVYVGDAAQAAATPGYLTVSDSNPGGANGGHLHIQNGSTLTLHSYAVLGYQAGKYGYATVTGSGSTWNNDAFLFVGLFGSGTLRIESGAEVSNSTGYLGRFSGSTGTATVTGAGSSWTNSSHLYVGHAGTGDLNIQAGGKVSNDNAHVGYSHTSTVDVTGAGSAWNSSGFVSVSNGSTLTIADGGSVNIGDAAAPAGATNGWLTISDHDASGVDGGKLSIVNNSTLTHHGHAALGAQSGEYGHVLVSKPGSSWTNAGNIYVGDHGTGVLTVSEGGVVTNDTAFIGNDVGSDGQVSVMGSGSTWQNTGGGVRVGENGTGTLLVSDGATAESTLSTLGTFASGSGTATVTGAGSNWTHSGNLEVGTFGTGTLTIEAGAAVDNSNGLIAHFAGSTGQVTVTGSGSTWTNSGRLDVGGSASSEGGAGTLNVFANGRVDVTDTLRVWSTGTLNLDGGTLDATTIDHTHGGAFDFTNGTLTIDTFQGSLVQDGGTLQIGGVGMPTTVITARDKLDDFDSYATGATNTATANVWNAEPSASPNSNIVTSDQGKSLQTLGGTAWSGAERDLSGTDAAVDVGETQTFFWQVKPSYTADGAGWDYDFMMGLSPDVNHINTVDAWSDFAVMPYINNEVATPFINASGPNSPWWTQINPGEWTSVWVVVNNDSADPTYDLYIATEADPDTPILVSSDADWRGWDNTEGMPIGPNMALNAIGFMAAGNPDTQYLIDNIWYSQDVNTSNPLTHPWTNSIEFTPETTTIQGDLTLSAGATVTFDIAGSGINDLLNIAGALTADGTLQVLLESGVTLAEGDNFDLLDFGSAIGAFATLDLPDLSALGLTWDSTGLLTDGILSVVSNILAGDLNADGFVGIADLNIVLGAWNQTVPPADPSADPSGDGFVGIADLNEVLGNWNAGTPPTTSANIPEPATLILCAALLPTLTRRRPKPLAA